MKKPSILDMERILRRSFPEEEHFPLLRTLSYVAWELDVPRGKLLRSLKKPREVLWYRGGKIYVPPDVYARWKQDKE